MRQSGCATRNRHGGAPEARPPRYGGRRLSWRPACQRHGTQTGCSRGTRATPAAPPSPKGGGEKMQRAPAEMRGRREKEKVEWRSREKRKREMRKRKPGPQPSRKTKNCLPAEASAEAGAV